MQRINQFFKELTEAMGTHVRFVIDEVYEGKELTTAATWHLGKICRLSIATNTRSIQAKTNVVQSGTTSSSP